MTSRYYIKQRLYVTWCNNHRFNATDGITPYSKSNEGGETENGMAETFESIINRMATTGKAQFKIIITNFPFACITFFARFSRWLFTMLNGHNFLDESVVRLHVKQSEIQRKRLFRHLVMHDYASNVCASAVKSERRDA